MRHLRYYIAATVILSLACAVWITGADIAPIQTPQAIQQSPPGAAGTSQNFWSQTSTGAATANTLTQPATSGKTNYCTGFEITGSGATAASTIAITLASGGTTIGNWSFTVPAGATLADNTLIVAFPQPFSGLAPGQTMVLTVPSFGAGNTAASATMHGFSQ